jgi:uncharacterized membrane protein
MKPIDLEIRIDCPVEHAWQTFKNVELMPEWVQGFLSLETIEGEPESAGSKHRLLFQEGKRQIEMIQTVVAFDPNERFVFTAATKGMRNACETTFAADGEGTIIRSSNQFIADGFFFKLMMPLMRGAITKRIEADFGRFKKLAEARFEG